MPSPSDWLDTSCPIFTGDELIRAILSLDRLEGRITLLLYDDGAVGVDVQEEPGRPEWSTLEVLERLHRAWIQTNNRVVAEGVKREIKAVTRERR